MLEKTYEVGIYCRLSRDDRERQVVSMSIASQKMLLSNFVNGKGWIIKQIYEDDGFSGTDFKRPGFAKMLQDIEKGRINCVVTKDLSRIGRNYVKTGFYTEEYFVEHHVRFIAVNDSVDTEKEYNDMAPFQNIMNEFYPKEISKKVRQVKRAWAMEGAFMGSQAPYGYQKSPEDKHKLIVDEAAARVIRDIFQRLLDGDSARCIAEQLNARGTDTPSVYQYRRNGKLPPENRDNLWSSELIISLARNPVYLGHMIQCKRENVSFKSKQRKVVPEEDWVRVNNTHEPLIDQQEWDKMQLNIAERRVVRRSNNQEVSLFAGLLRCSNCGKKLVSTMKTQKKVPKRIYKCSTYNQKGKQACSSHWITEDYILKILKDDLAFYAGHLRDNEDEFTQAFVELSNQNKSENIMEQREKLRHLEQRRSLIEDVIKKLIEENCEGNITATALNSIIGKYYQEENELHSEIMALTKQIDLWEDQLIDIQQWIAALQSYNPDQLGRKEVLQLIHKIIVRDKDSEDQESRIEIHYLHVGAIDKSTLVL